MSKSSRTKGAAGERELLRLLGDEIGIVLTRNLQQTREGGADCLMVPGFAIEVKRVEQLSRPKWWKQAVKQGEAVNREPIVFYRQSAKPGERITWRALIKHGTGYREAEWLDAVDHVREKLVRLYAIYPAEKPAAQEAEAA